MPRLANALRVAHDASPPLCHALHLAADALKDDPDYNAYAYCRRRRRLHQGPGLSRHIT